MSPSVNEVETSFKKSWKSREEAFYTHWTSGEPKNQIQLAFRNHWTLFNQLMRNAALFNNGRRCLEVGCGRGSLSSYFSEAGYASTLLDISPDIIQVAQDIFNHHRLQANFITGDAKAMPFADSSFDVVFSIGLMEHFEDPDLLIQEQMRVLDEGGILFAYIVPKYTNNVQKDYEWLNAILKGYAQQSGTFQEKDFIYRNDSGSETYLPLYRKYGLADLQTSGVYPLPMISHSTEFPFSLMPEASEAAIVQHFSYLLEQRAAATQNHPWLCEEGYGQAFLIWGVKSTQRGAS